MVGFVGPNGAGKTTAMRIALGVLEPDRGEVRWRGKPVDQSVRRRFGYMPEERGLYPKMRVLDQLVYLATLHGLTRTDATAEAQRMIDVLDEPFSGLDPVGVDVLSGVLRERAEARVPVVFSSHQLDLVERLCESVVLINKGRIV